MFDSKVFIIMFAMITCFLGYKLFDLLTENLFAFIFNFGHDTLNEFSGSLYKTVNNTIDKKYTEMGPPNYGMTKVRSQYKGRRYVVDF